MLVKLQKFIDEQFEEGSRPCKSTVLRWIENGNFPFPVQIEKIGGTHFVRINNKSAKSIVNNVLTG